MTGPAAPDPLDRIAARARQDVEYEEEGARKDGTTPNETWDEWVHGRDVLALVEVARAARDRYASGHNDWCDLMLGDEANPYPCTCGHAELTAALARLDNQ